MDNSRRPGEKGYWRQFQCPYHSTRVGELWSFAVSSDAQQRASAGG